MAYFKTFSVQFNALFSKNVSVLLGKYWMLLFTILAPAIGPILVSMVNNLGNDQSAGATQDSFQPLSLNFNPNQETLVYYTPNDSKHNQIMQNYASISGSKVLPFDSDLELSKAYLDNYNNEIQYKDFFAAVIFKQSTKQNLTIYNVWHDPDNDQEQFTKDGKYQPKVSILQLKLDQSILSTFTQSTNLNVDLSFVDPIGPSYIKQDRSNPEFVDSSVSGALSSYDETAKIAKILLLICSILPFSFIPMLVLSVSTISTEKRNSLLVPIRRMGLYESTYWLSSFIPMVFISLLASGFLCLSVYLSGEYLDFELFKHPTIDLTVVYLMSFVYGISLSCIGLLISACFSRPLYVNLCQGLVSFGIVVVNIAVNIEFMPIQSNSYPNFLKVRTEAWGHLLMIFLPFLNYGNFWNTVVYAVTPNVLNNRATNFVYSIPEFSNTANLPPLADSLTKEAGSPFLKAWNSQQPALVLFILALLSVPILLTLCWYFNQMLTTEEGFSLKWYFPFTAAYWTGEIKETKSDAQGDEKSKQYFGDVVKKERDISLREDSVRTYKISKVYKTTTAVKEFTISMKKGNVYGLLGHNGSGKTTTINMLTGVTTPSFGDAFVFGRSVKTEMQFIRDKMGVCSQFDLLYPSLTGAQHIIFYAKFRGIDLGGKSMKLYIQEKLNMVQLSEAANRMVKGYSGGMKRRLSVALSTIGNDLDIVFLDEPTTGLDPLSKRRVWDVIKDLKKDKIIVLTTHSMEEADSLSDHLSIMHGGKLKASGTPLYLKNKYGKGYQVSILGKSNATPPNNGNTLTPSPQEEETIKSGDQMSQMLEKWISHVLPGSNIVSSAAGSLTVGIGKGSTKQLASFLRVLQRDRKLEWSVSNSTLEEVFLRLCAVNDGVNIDIDDQDPNGTGQELICRICNDRKAQDVVLYTKSGLQVNVSGVVCQECADGIKEDTNISEQQQHQQRHDGLIDFESFSNIQNGSNHKSDNHRSGDNDDKDRVEPVEFANNIFGSQLKAIFIKNAVLDARMKKTNICTCCLVVLILILLSLASAMFLDVDLRVVDENCPVTVIDGDSNDYYRRGDEVVVFGPAVTLTCNPEKFVKLATKECQFDLTDRFGSSSSAKECRPVGGRLGKKMSALTITNDPSYEYSFTSTTRPPFSDAESSTFVSVMRPRLWYQDAANGVGVSELFDGSIYERPLDLVELGMSAVSNNSTLPTDEIFSGDVLSQLPSNTAFGFKSVPNSGGGINQFMASKQRELLDIGKAISDYGNCSDIAENSGGSIYVAPTSQDFWTRVNETYPDFGMQVKTSSIQRDSIDVNYELNFYRGTHDIRQTTFPYVYRSIPKRDFWDEGCMGATVRSQHTGSDSFRISSASTYHSQDLKVVINSMSNAVLRKALGSAPLTKQQLNAIPEFSKDLDSASMNDFPDGGSIVATLSKLPVVYTESPFAKTGRQVIIFIIFLVTMFATPRMVVLWVSEKSSNLFEMIRIQGLSATRYWIGNYIYGLFLNSVLCLLAMTIGFILLQPFKNSSSPLMIVLCFLLWAHSLVCLAIFVSAIFKKPATAGLSTYTLYIVSMMVASYLIVSTDSKTGSFDMSTASAIGGCLYPPVGFAIGLNIAFVSGRFDIFLPVFGIWFVGSFILCFVGVYLHLIRPGKLGVAPMDPLFGLTRKFKQQNNASFNKSNDGDYIESGDVDRDVLMEERRVLQSLNSDGGDNSSAVKIAKLVKAFGEKKAVDGLSVDVKYGEVFGLLGPNGAGKSTTIACVTGLAHPTNGKIEISGQDIDKVENLWKMVGLCPQMDCIWDELTIEQHLLFYCRLRGIPSNRIRGTVRRIAEDVGLDGDPLRQLASQMSGGMKRRLSIGIAMTASPRICVLDEPTTGLDPDTKLKIHKVIDKISAKGDRCVIITTHSMEEADALCSRIGIVCEGRLKVLGNQVHLKNRFGTGFKLSLCVEMKTSTDRLGGSDLAGQVGYIEQEQLEQIDRMIKIRVSPLARLVSRSDTHLQSLLSKIEQLEVQNGRNQQSNGLVTWNVKLSYTIPVIQQQASSDGEESSLDVASIFENIETESKRLSILDWAINQTTLEDVFVKVVENSEG